MQRKPYKISELQYLNEEFATRQQIKEFATRQQIIKNYSNALQDAFKPLSAMQISPLYNEAFRNSLKALYSAQTVSVAKIFQDSFKPPAPMQISSLAKASEDALKHIRALQANPFQSHDLKLLANVSNQHVSVLQTAQREISQSWADLFVSLTEDLAGITRLPPKVVPLPSIELYNSHRVLEVFSEEDIAPELQAKYQNIDEEIALDTDDSLEILLLELDPKLIRMWRGMKDALTSEGEDKVRHFSISARELFTQIIHKLAPDDEVKEWTDDPNHFHEKIPTRKARALYICRSFDHSQFSNFVAKDINASIALSDLFQSGVHTIETDLTSGQMSALKIRIEGTLRFLLETARVMKT